MNIQRTSSYIPSSQCCSKYDVFLSFRGEETRNNFTDHLQAALKQSGINVFMDDKKIEKGKSISLELCKAIEESRISIVIFSRNYAFSTWCLDELIQIVHCMKAMKLIVIPIFYDVNPSVVRKQTGIFHEAFAKHEEAFTENKEKVQNWRTALTEVANLSGWDSRNRHQSEFIQDIVKDIISRNLNLATSSTLVDLVGINSRLKKLKRLMGEKSNDVHMIGIYGMGGIGKTTIARAIYEIISCEFEGCSFLANVRETSEKSGLVHLQKQLLSQILRETYVNIWNVYEGIKMISSRLRHIKVLVVIDDVNDIKQLDELIGKHDWFGSGSRIIITTRDKHLLKTHGVDKMYSVEELDDDEAFQLFSFKAFKNYQPSKEYMELSKHVVKYAGGLPLALKVLGSFLFDKTIEEWESALQRLGRDSEEKILESLQVSFDGLIETDKKIFLDIACFFKGKNKDHVIRILAGCGFNPSIGIGVLIDKSLLTISDDNILWMHDLLQEMGQQIVKRESLQEPGKRSRLWEEADVHHVLTKNTGTEVVEGIVLETNEHLHASALAFLKMSNLRLLKVQSVQLSEGLNYLSNELRLLDWHGYPSKLLPSSLQLDKTVELQMHYSHIQKIWKESKPLYSLKIMNLSHSYDLKTTPDFTEVPNIEELILEGCTRLREIHPSLFLHGRLILLNLKNCASLTTLPRKIYMPSLKEIVLSGCLKLKRFPGIVRRMKRLSELFLDGTAIKELPFSIELLKGLVLLNLKDCNNLVRLPSNINSLKSLKILNLSGCSKLENVPENLGQVESLEELDLSGTAIRQPASSIFFMKNLKQLSFRGCKGPPSSSWYSRFPYNLMSTRSSNSMALVLPSLLGLRALKSLDLSDCNLGEGAIPIAVGNLVSLELLYLRKNNFLSLPVSINLLSKLMEFDLEGCESLQSLPELPSNLIIVTVDACTSLERLSDHFKSCQSLFKISCANCFKLLDCNNEATSMLKKISHTRNKFSMIVPGSKIPNWFSYQREASSVRIKSHPDLYRSSKLLGYAVCAVFSINKHQPDPHKHRYHFLTCEGKAHNNLFSESHRYVHHTLLKDNYGQSMSNHLFLLYFPRFLFKRESEYYHIEFKFKSRWGARILEIKRCGVHPIYEHGIANLFNQSTEQCSSSFSGNLNEFRQNSVVSKADAFTTKRSLTYNDKVKPRGRGNSEEEPQLKRHRKLQFL